MIALNPIRTEPMKAEITVTSQTIEARLIELVTGNTVSTNYFDTMDEALDSVESYNLVSLDLIQENF